MSTRPLTPAFASELIRLEDGRSVIVRPLRPDDARRYPAFDRRLSAEDRRMRFFSASHLSERQIWAFTHFDRAEASAIIALDPQDGSMLGVARLHRLSDGSGEFAVLVRSDLKGLGLGRALMERVLDTASAIGVRAVFGIILRENVGMLALARELGFTLRADPDDRALMRAELDAARAPRRASDTIVTLPLAS